MRTFVVGDIHGHLEKLERLLPLLRERAAPGDSLVFVGDYIDRGPESRGVIDRVLALEAGDWPGLVVPLRGNHEVLMLDFISDDPRYDPQVWIRNGGLETVMSYTGGTAPRDWERCIPAEHLEFLHRLRGWHADENGYYVHAGFTPGRLPAECDDEAMQWIRDEFIRSEYAWDRVVVFGHTPQHEEPAGGFSDLSQVRWRPLVRPEKIGIDTGAAYGGPLTAVVLPEREFIAAA